MNNCLDVLSALASIATVLGVFLAAGGVTVAAYQLRLSHEQSITNFEDQFARDYRDLVGEIPTKVFLNETLSEDEIKNGLLDEFYQYFDMCNEQIFLYQQGRIREATWGFWVDGITANMKRPAFATAWTYISKRCGSDFTELKTMFPTGLGNFGEESKVG